MVKGKWILIEDIIIRKLQIERGILFCVSIKNPDLY